MAGRIQNEDIKSVAELVSAGATAASLPNDDKVYVTANSINKTLRNAIIDGDLSGGGGINYVLNPNAASSTTGWSTYADAAGALPVDGTGGSPASTLTRSTTTPLRGAASFLWTKSAANRQGEGFSYDFTIDAADKAKVIQASFDYFIASGTYADSDLTVYIYDVTNALVIQPAGYTIQNALVQMKQTATFQTASNSTSYRLIVHTASTSASAYSLQFDNFAVGPQIVTQGAAITDWQSFTPNGTWTTNTSYTGKYRRVGDVAEIAILVTCSGAPTATGLAVSIPSGLSIDSSKIMSANPDTDARFGQVRCLDAGINAYSAGTVGYSTSTSVGVYLTYTAATYGQPAQVSQVAPFTFGSGDQVSIIFSVPILGWSSNLQLSSDTDTRVVAARAYISSASVSVGALALIPFNSTSFDTHSAFVSGSSAYRAPVSGIYEIIVDTETTSTANNLILINGSVYQRIGPNAVFGTCQAMVSLAAGDLVTIFSNNAGAVTYQGTSQSTSLSVKRLSGPATIAASESVSFSANTSTTAGTTSTPFIYTTKEHDTHNAYSTSTGKFTAPIAGKYCFQFNNFGGATTFQAKLHKNGTAVYQGSSTVATVSVGSGSHTISMLAGDTMEVRPEVNATASGGAATNTFSGFRVGN